ncbi:MAG TPA: hypothetical protein PKK26_12360 [Candidatus Wallbacteria bacterium]|nr:hypothetical protein [Candidatus Wallbacteria bacterium]
MFKYSRQACFFAVSIFLFIFVNGAYAGNKDVKTIDELKTVVEKLISENQKQSAIISNLEIRLKKLENNKDAVELISNGKTAEASPQEALDRAISEIDSQKASNQKPAGAKQISFTAPAKAAASQNLIDISYSVMGTAGWSDKKNNELSTLFNGGHDPNQRGFNLNASEFSLSGAVDPYFRGEAHIVYVPRGVELEEAFLTTTKLPDNLQLKLGYFLNEFGRNNPTHPHSWNFIDKPIIASRIFGADGFRSEGMRLSWLVPVKWYSELYLGLQNANSESAASFLSGKVDPESSDKFANTAFDLGVGGRPLVYNDTRSIADLARFIRWENSFALNNSTTAKLGFSGLFGPNSSGADGKTNIFGADIVLKWRPEKNFRGWPYLVFEGEFMKRKYAADGFSDQANGISLPSDNLNDSGYYMQLVKGFKYGWASAIRYEKASGSGESIGGRSSDIYRADRTRFAPVLIYYPSEFSRMRLQYNYDRSDCLPSGKANSYWFCYEIMYGSHPAHKF